MWLVPSAREAHASALLVRLLDPGGLTEASGGRGAHGTAMTSRSLICQVCQRHPQRRTRNLGGSFGAEQDVSADSSAETALNPGRKS